MRTLPSLLTCLTGSLLATTVYPSPVSPTHHTPAVASLALPLQRRIRHASAASSRNGFVSLDGILDYATQDHKPTVQDADGNVDFVTAAALASRQADPLAEGVGPAINARNQVEYITPVEADGDAYSLIIDTGSSDTWFVKDGFRCVDSLRRDVPFEACRFGPVWDGGFPGGEVPGRAFDIQYGNSNGPFIHGEMGYSDLTVANITLARQQIALATSGMWYGDDITSGILGLGLPGLTGLDAASTYDPLVVTVNKQVAAPVFSLALSREPYESFIAFGGVPPQVRTKGPWARTPIEKLQRADGSPPDYFFYTVRVDEVLMNNTQQNLRASNLPGFIVDSGTTLNYFPYDMAAAVNALFNPPAVLDSSEGAWFVPCNDTVPPSLGITLGGTTLWTDPSSMILPEVKNRQGLCATGITATDAFPYILGDTFMQNLLTVFDLGDMEIRYAQRDFS